MTYAGKVNLVLSVVQGLMVAGIAALLGSGVWWLWGLAFAGVTCVGLACVQIAREEANER